MNKYFFWKPHFCNNQKLPFPLSTETDIYVMDLKIMSLLSLHPPIKFFIKKSLSVQATTF